MSMVREDQEKHLKPERSSSNEETNGTCFEMFVRFQAHCCSHDNHSPHPSTLLVSYTLFLKTTRCICYHRGWADKDVVEKMCLN